MMRTGYEPILIGLLLLTFLSGCGQAGESKIPSIELDQIQLEWIGAQVFRNECASKKECLVHWNQGEAFPSLGIGHFIWYPSGVEGPFVESFPEMIDYLTAQGVVLPDWLASLDPFDAPWDSRESIRQTANIERLEELRNFLFATRGQQAGFLVQRAEKALGRVILAAAEQDRALVSGRVNALASSPGGVYALVDYVNFKGEGLAVTERYKGQGWGLLQVLQEMENDRAQPALGAFRESAARVLALRAENADRPIEKERWLPGWLNRLETYREPE